MSAALEDQADTILTDDDIISHSQTVRRLLVKEMTKEKIPDDIKERYLLLTALADADRTAIQNKKIGASERQGAADRQAAILIAKMGAHYGATSPFEGQRPPGELPTLDSARIGPIEIKPGETEIGISGETCDAFMARMDAVVAAEHPSGG